MSSPTSPDRRTFLAGAAASVATAALTSRAAGAADRVGVALIGCGGMGNNHLRMLAARPDVRVLAVCDPDANRLAESARTVEKASKQSPKGIKDLREVLDDKAVDAVWIATPDHWHAPATILACAAGKHVYVEKPCSHNVREGRLMLEAARRHNRAVQVGTQARSSTHALQAVQRLRDGVIGDVLSAKAWNSQLRRNIGKQKPAKPPAHLDFDLWLGPAPQRPYQSNLLHGIWRFWYDYGVGDIGNDGIHEIDVARWGLGATGHPSTVAALGSKYFFDDDQEFPDTQCCLFEYPDDGKVGSKRQLVFEQRIWSPYTQEGLENGVAFYGTKGYMIVGKGSFRVFGPKNVPGEAFTKGQPDLAAHHQNFLDCARSGGRPNADVEEGHLSATLAHLGNIACRVGRVLHFDPKAEQIIGDDEANRLVRRTYRDDHWAAPANV
jgi:predicted dehydrogenase